MEVQIRKGSLSVRDIYNTVTNFLDIDPDLVEGRWRKRNVVEARQMFCYLAKKHTSASLKEIAEMIGGRDHTTAIHSIKAMTNLIETDAYYKYLVKDIESILRVSGIGLEVRKIKLARSYNSISAA